MQEFFTWNLLATYAGAVLATTFATQALKELPFIKKLPTRIFSYIIAVMILILATFFTGQLSVSAIILSLFNALIVSFASNGAFDASRLTRGKLNK